MTKRPEGPSARKVGTRYALQNAREGRYQALRWPVFLLGAAAFGLWWFGPEVFWHPWLEPMWDYFLGAGSNLLLVAGVGCLLLWLLALLAPRSCHVQCLQKGLRIGTPLWPVDVPYDCIKIIRPIPLREIFGHEHAPWQDRDWLQRLGGSTTVVVDLRKKPASDEFLALFVSPCVYSARDHLFCFLVRDWMRFSQELESFRQRDLTQRVDAQRQDATAEMLSRWSGRN